jgi:ABC-type dipeptide/oligopeptide/nickel transport system permease subunit
MSEPISISAGGQAPGVWRRLLRNPMAIIAIVVLALVAFVVIAGPSIESFRYAPEATSEIKHGPPGEAHWFGTDQNGRDVFSRVIQGARISLLVGLCGALVSFIIGTAYGMVSGYIGGRTDNVMMRLVEALQSVPRLILVIVAIFVFDKKLASSLNEGSLFTLFGENPRLTYTLVALLVWLLWWAAKQSTGEARRSWLGVLTVLVACAITSVLRPYSFNLAWLSSFFGEFRWFGHVIPPPLDARMRLFGTAMTFFFAIIFAGTLLDRMERAKGLWRAFAGVAAPVAVALYLAPFVDQWLAGTPLKPMVGYSKVVILITCLGLIEWLSMARIVRGQVLALKEQQFVLAARALGQSHARIILRHLLPNLVGVVVVYLTLTIPSVILDESFLSFLGLGVNDPQASWGSLLSDGKNAINPVKSYWWLLVFPAAAMSVTLLALNFLGDAIRDALDPRARR